MLSDGPPMVSTFISKRTGSAEYLYNGNQTKKQEDNPDYFVALE